MVKWSNGQKSGIDTLFLALHCTTYPISPHSTICQPHPAPKNPGLVPLAANLWGVFLLSLGDLERESWSCRRSDV